MAPWILSGALYLIGIIGLHALARDLNGASMEEWRPYVALIFWPVVIPVMWIVDLYDKIREA